MFAGAGTLLAGTRMLANDGKVRLTFTPSDNRTAESRALLRSRRDGASTIGTR